MFYNENVINIFIQFINCFLVEFIYEVILIRSVFHIYELLK